MHRLKSVLVLKLKGDSARCPSSLSAGCHRGATAGAEGAQSGDHGAMAAHGDGKTRLETLYNNPCEVTYCVYQEIWYKSQTSDWPLIILTLESPFSWLELPCQGTEERWAHLCHQLEENRF